MHYTSDDDSVCSRVSDCRRCLPDGGYVIHAKKAYFYKDDELRKRAEMAGVEQCDDGLTAPPYHTKLRAELGEARFARLFVSPPKRSKKLDKATPTKPVTPEASLASACAKFKSAYKQFDSATKGKGIKV